MFVAYWIKVDPNEHSTERDADPMNDDTDAGMNGVITTWVETNEEGK